MYKLTILSALILIAISCNNNSGGDHNKPPKPGTSFEIMAVVTKPTGKKDGQLVTMAFVEDSLGKIDTQYYERVPGRLKPVLDSLFMPVKDSLGKVKTYQELEYRRIAKDSVNPRVEFKNFAELTKTNPPKQ